MLCNSRRRFSVDRFLSFEIKVGVCEWNRLLSYLGSSSSGFYESGKLVANSACVAPVLQLAFASENLVIAHLFYLMTLISQIELLALKMLSNEHWRIGDLVTKLLKSDCILRKSSIFLASWKTILFCNRQCYTDTSVIVNHYLSIDDRLSVKHFDHFRNRVESDQSRHTSHLLTLLLFTPFNAALVACLRP